jgi:hypothetical protein
MDYKEFFLTDNKSGWKTSENKLKKHNIGLYNLIINFCDIIDSLRGLPFRVKVWHFINDIKYIPTCNHCGKDLKFGPSLNSGYGVCILRMLSEHIMRNMVVVVLVQRLLVIR